MASMESMESTESIGCDGCDGVDGLVDGSMLPVDCWHQELLAQTFMFLVILVTENLFANNGHRPKWLQGGPQDPHITCHFTYVILFLILAIKSNMSVHNPGDPP